MGSCRRSAAEQAAAEPEPWIRKAGAKPSNQQESVQQLHPVWQRTRFGPERKPSLHSIPSHPCHPSHAGTVLFHHLVTLPAGPGTSYGQSEASTAHLQFC